MKSIFNIIMLTLCAVLISCGNPKPQKTPVQLPSQGGKRSERSIIKVPYTQFKHSSANISDISFSNSLMNLLLILVMILLFVIFLYRKRNFRIFFSKYFMTKNND